MYWVVEQLASSLANRGIEIERNQKGKIKDVFLVDSGTSDDLFLKSFFRQKSSRRLSSTRNEAVCQTTVRLGLCRQLQDQAANVGAGYGNDWNRRGEGERRKQCPTEL